MRTTTISYSTVAVVIYYTIGNKAITQPNTKAYPMPWGCFNFHHHEENRYIPVQVK